VGTIITKEKHNYFRNEIDGYKRRKANPIPIRLSILTAYKLDHFKSLNHRKKATQ